MPSKNNNNGNSNNKGSVLPNPSSPSTRTIREGVEYAPSPTYRRPDRPGSGGSNGK